MAALVAAAVVAAAGLLVLVLNLVWAGQHASTMRQAQALEGKGQYADERQLLERYVNAKPPKQYQADALKKLGGAAYAAGDYHAAYQWYLRADAAAGKPDLDVKLGVAQSAEQIGDKATSINYYRQLVALYPNPKGATLVKVQQYGDHIMFLEQDQ
jgi:TolA-binding protein